MYYFNILEILEKESKLTSAQIKLKYIEKWGSCNRNSFQRALKKLVDNGEVEKMRVKVKGVMGGIIFYKIKK